MERTPWFNAWHSPPLRPGEYEGRCVLHNWRADGTRVYWTGEEWLLPINGERFQTNFGTKFCDEWRGLAEKP